MQRIVILLLQIYRRALSPLLATLGAPWGLGCRFQPTCSEYALIAVQRHGVWRGCWLSGRRLARCHPWGSCGCDPVPETQLRN